MQPPDVQFTTTDDGVTIAYSSIGTGPPLLITQNFVLNHLELEWMVPSIATLFEALAERYRLIRYNLRSTGMSERRPGLDLSLTSMGLDIEAVIHASGEEAVTLVGANTMGPVVIDYAARHPDRVANLILCDTYPASEGSVHAGWMKAQAALDAVGQPAHQLWQEVTADNEKERQRINALGDAARPDDLEETMPAILAWDAEASLSDVKAPTLVLLSRDSKVASLEESRGLAMGIPSAQLKTVDAELLPYFGDHDAVLDTIAEFLGTDEPAAVTASAAKGFTTVVFTDLVSSTEMVSRLGDEAGRAAVREVEKRVTELATDFGGEVIKNLGDGSMVAFPSTSSALSFAVELQEAMADSDLDLRIGMAAGEPIHEDGDLHGAVVAQASRVADKGQAGEILVAESVHQLALGKGFDFKPAGEATLKGFDEPVRLWKVTGI